MHDTSQRDNIASFLRLPLRAVFCHVRVCKQRPPVCTHTCDTNSRMHEQLHRQLIQREVREIRNVCQEMFVNRRKCGNLLMIHNNRNIYIFIDRFDIRSVLSA